MNEPALEASAVVSALARAGAGVNNIPVDALAARGIPVFNAPGANANAVKELVGMSCSSTAVLPTLAKRSGSSGFSSRSKVAGSRAWTWMTWDQPA